MATLHAPLSERLVGYILDLALLYSLANSDAASFFRGEFFLCYDLFFRLVINLLDPRFTLGRLGM